jgi:hypothetical protein
MRENVEDVTQSRRAFVCGQAVDGNDASRDVADEADEAGDASGPPHRIRDLSATCLDTYLFLSANGMGKRWA